MRMGILGSMQVWDGAEWHTIGAPKWRALLAALLVRPGTGGSVQQLIDDVWATTRRAAPSTRSTAMSVVSAGLWATPTAGSSSSYAGLHTPARRRGPGQLDALPAP